jgi:hypothetical protein
MKFAAGFGLKLAREPRISPRNPRKLDGFAQNRFPPRIKSGAGFLLIALYLFA